MMSPENNELHYPNPDGTVQLGSVMAPPPHVTWTLCTIKIKEGHYGIYPGAALLKAEMQAISEEG